VSRWVVILAGGVGSRFWPLSTPERPKQLLPLVTEQPLLMEAASRLVSLAPPERTLILTNAGLVPAIATLLPDVPRENLIAEPRPAGTAAALAWAAAEIVRRDGADATMLSVHADWSIADAEGFRTALLRAEDAATTHAALVTVGVVPSRPDPGFGYIAPGETVGEGVRRVERFVEKPDRQRAAAMLAQGYLWNSGIFVWRVGDFLEEIRALTPEVAPALDAAGGGLETFFGAVQSIAVDVGVLERSARVLVVDGDFGWDDVGTWGALGRVRERDARGNAVRGNAHLLDANDCVVHAAGSRVVLYGVSDLVVVTHGALTVVTTPDRSADLKSLIESLPADWSRA